MIGLQCSANQLRTAVLYHLLKNDRTEISRSTNQSDPLMPENPAGVQAEAFIEVATALQVG